MLLRDEKGQLWALCTLRKSHACMCCGGALLEGDGAFRLLGNGKERRQRVCIDCAANGACLCNL